MALATNSTPGSIQLAGVLAGNNNGAAPALTSSGVTAGSYSLATITVGADGRITAASNGTGADLIAIAPNATTSTKGMVQIGGGLSVSSGLVSVDYATVQANLTNATTSVKGIVQVGTNIDVSSGVISVATATTGVKGIVQVGTNLSVTSGTISVATATTGVKGIVQVGTNIDVTSGTISVATATTGVKGIVQVGTNIDVSSGVISVATATNSTLGVVNSANTSNITITTGAINTGANVPLLNTNNTFTKAQNVASVSLTSGTTVSVDASLSNVFTLTLAHNGTLADPTNLGVGKYTFIITQDGTGNRTLAYGSSYKFATGSSSTLSTAAGAVDVLWCVSNGTNVYCTLAKAFA